MMRYKIVMHCAYKLFGAVAVLSVMVSCGAHSAINRTENYANAWPSANFSTKRIITVGVIDSRPYVVEGKVGPEHVGVMRGGYGNPFYMNTESGRPLSEDLGIAISSGLKNSGLRAGAVPIKSATNFDDALRQCAGSQRDRILILKLNEWKSDTYSTSRFLYEIIANVYDDKGNLVASYSDNNLHQKREEISAVSPLEAGRHALSRMLNSPEIVQALM